MAELGRINRLRIVRRVDFGVYLDAGEMGEILMPKRYVTSEMDIDEYVNVFVYLDGEERNVATTDIPLAQVGDFAHLKVKMVENVGAFCEWVPMKDLLVPFSEQKVKMEIDKSYIVYVYIDPKTNRVAGTMKLEKMLDQGPPDYTTNQEVDLLIWTQTDIGYKAIINNTHTGVLYKNEVIQRLTTGQKLIGYIKKVRDDGKIDLSLQELGFQKVDAISQKILQILEKAGGFLPYHDKTDPEVISSIFGISKKTFKQSIGTLYKQRVIEITEKGINKI
jgi:uncharacterized protein